MTTVACPCPLCGRSAEALHRPPKRYAPWAFGFFAILLVPGLFFGYSVYDIWPGGLLMALITIAVWFLDGMRQGAWWFRCRHCERQWQAPPGWHP